MLNAALAAPWSLAQAPGPATRPATPAAPKQPAQPRPVPKQIQDWQLHLRREQQVRLPLPVFAKVVAPKDTKITFYSAGGQPNHFATQVTVGLRSRHRYAFALENPPAGDARRFYGTIEVLRGPRLPEGVKGSDVPVLIHFSPSDLELLAKTTDLAEWGNRVEYLPIR